MQGEIKEKEIQGTIVSKSTTTTTINIAIMKTITITLMTTEIG